ncbi:hypothetical protein [Bradyrhizobium sp.]|nr:hypothetical protein [Bradyrhizobium sp.]MDO9295882.1 hypothetical protein [Bradyrhizobium sp.]
MWEEISGGNELILLGKREVNSRGYCSSFNFKGRRADFALIRHLDGSAG